MLEVFGLPTHILLLHSVVVLAPAAGLGAIAYVLRPAWRRSLQWPVAVLAALAAGLTALTAQAGEALERALPRNALIHAHAEQGDLLEAAAAVFVAAVVVTVALTGPWAASKVPLLARAGAVRWLVAALQAISVLAAVFLIYQTVVTGHTGAQAAWSDWRNR